MNEDEHRLPDLPGPLLALDLTPAGDWIAIVQQGTQQVLLIGNEEVMLPQPCRFPAVRAIDATSVLIIDTRLSKGARVNAWVMTSNGEIQACFNAGDSIQDILVTPSGFVITYFDEGIYGDHPLGREGVVLLDRAGEFHWGYASSSGGFIDDCYCACLTTNNHLLFLPYTGFPLVRVDLERMRDQTWPTPDQVHGAQAMTSQGNVIFWHAPYHAPRAIIAWRIGSDTVHHIGDYMGPLRGLPGGLFLTVGSAGYTVVSLGEHAAGIE